MPTSPQSLVRKTVAVLRAVAGGGAGIGLSDVGRASGIPKATCLRVLNDLVDEKLVTFDSEDKRYAIAFGALAVFGGLLDVDGASTHINRELRGLADATKETSGLDVLVGPDVVVLAQVQGPFTIGYSPRGAPRTLETWNTSTGKVLLAELDLEELQSTHGSALDSAANARGSVQPFLDELVTIRDRGYGTARDEMETGAAAVAAPVHVDGRVVAAVWIGGPSFRITTERSPALAEVVVGTAKVLGDILTVTGGRLDGAYR